MQGLMQPWPLTVDRILDHAARWHGEREIVTRSVAGPLVRTTYEKLHARARRLSSALLAAGIRQGDRVATLAWNTDRHMEVWYATMGIGAVCHTLNPRLFVEQLAYIINHAEDRIVFTDAPFLPLLEQTLSRCPSVERVVVMSDEDEPPETSLKNVVAYEPLLTEQATASWGGFDENTAAGLCYTSGTTGDPKGVLYSHRSNFLHTFMTLQQDIMGLSQRDVVLPIVPMFHANAWGLAFSAPAVGAKLVMPGARLDGAAIHELIESEAVTFSAAVPTVWQVLLQHLLATNGKLTSLRKVVVGGAACPEHMIRAFHDRFGVEVLHGWGMTELSPLGCVAAPRADVVELPFEDQMPCRAKQGRPPLGVDMRIVDDSRADLPHDGTAHGYLLVSGPAVAASYFKSATADTLDGRGYFDTGDIASIDRHGFMQITDRAKDMIKSGGEWISSIAIENIVAAHPKAALAAVIGMPHPKWSERPLLVVQLKEGQSATAEELLAFLEGRIARWWMPDEVRFVERIPLGATGKIDKKQLRATHTI
jgi:fatty-acyl-CoA synthase